MRLINNIRRWPRVFTVLVMLTVLELGIDFGLCRYIGRQSLGDSLFIVTVVLVAVGVVAGIVYSLFAPMHQFSVVALLDRVEGRHVSAISEETDEESNEYDEYEENPEDEEELDEESEESAQ